MKEEQRQSQSNKMSSWLSPRSSLEQRKSPATTTTAGIDPQLQDRQRQPNGEDPPGEPGQQGEVRKREGGR